MRRFAALAAALVVFLFGLLAAEGGATVIAEGQGAAMAATDIANFSNYLFETPKAARPRPA
jgi:hypothetical protein